MTMKHFRFTNLKHAVIITGNETDMRKFQAERPLRPDPETEELIMKKLMALVLISLLALCPALSCLGEANIPYFDNIEANDITFYDMLGDTPSMYEAGPVAFGVQYFTTATNQPPTAGPAPIVAKALSDRWKTVAEEILLGHKADPKGSTLEKILWGYQNDVLNNSYAHSFSGYVVGGSDSSVKKAAKAAMDKIDKAPTSGRVVHEHKVPSTLSDEASTTIAFYTGYEYDLGHAGVNGVSDGAMAVIFSNMNV